MKFTKRAKKWWQKNKKKTKITRWYGEERHDQVEKCIYKMKINVKYILWVSIVNAIRFGCEICTMVTVCLRQISVCYVHWETHQLRMLTTKLLCFFLCFFVIFWRLLCLLGTNYQLQVTHIYEHKHTRGN